MKWPEEYLRGLGLRQCEFRFTTPKRVLIRYDKSHSDTMENVSTITLQDGSPLGTVIILAYRTGNRSESISTAMENIKELIISDEIVGGPAV